MKLKSMQDLYIAELKDLYSAESQLLKALPKMAKAASSETLKAAIEEHIDVTEKHKQRLEQIAEKLDFKPGGLIEEGEEAIKAEADPAVHDAALIAAAQRIEHYEIAGYGTARTFAKTLGFDDAADLLQQTLDEESQTDQTLTDLAESQINPKAAQAVS
jgi:ferritin-like metal-binding protein YciE